jgi:predicted ATPase
MIIPIEDADRFFILTGGPGSGKTTLIAALGEAGYPHSSEAGRGVIRYQVAIGGRALSWRDPAAFAERMLCWEMRSHHLAREQAGPTFFDRGMPDVAGYLRLLGLPVPAHVAKAVEAFRYNRRVFIAPPWPDIFRQDSERRQSFDEAVRTYEAMVATYGEYGCELIELPRSSVAERVRFVIENAGIAN